MKQRFTTVHDRYQVSDSCCGQVETATSLKKASEIAKNHADRHAIDHDNTTTVVTVFDVMARRDCQDTWEFPIANLALIEIAAQLAEMNKEKAKTDNRGPYVKMREQLAEEENSYVAYLYFSHPISGEPVLHIGDSDTPGAFKVFRRRM